MLVTNASQKISLQITKRKKKKEEITSHSGIHHNQKPYSTLTFFKEVISKIVTTIKKRAKWNLTQTTCYIYMTNIPMFCSWLYHSTIHKFHSYRNVTARWKTRWDHFPNCKPASRMKISEVSRHGTNRNNYHRKL